jgi:hypothetical protein
MGRAIVEGGVCIRFCPRYPRHILQFSSVEDMLETTQREFWALPLEGGTADEGMREEAFGLAVAEADGALAAVASTYSLENDAVYDGLSRPGPRLVTFAPVLKQGASRSPTCSRRSWRRGSAAWAPRSRSSSR